MKEGYEEEGMSEEEIKKDIVSRKCYLIDGLVDKIR